MSTKSRLVVIALSAAVIAPPVSTASARFTRDAPVPAEPQKIIIAPPSASDAFDWNDAALGAGGAIAVLLLAGGGVVAVRHSRRSGVPSVPAH